MNILTFDVEEWFHLLDFDATRNEEQWKNYEVRIYENVDRILDILESTDTKATFFIIGWVAKTYPDVVKKIAAKYQIGSHTMSHQLVWQQSREELASPSSFAPRQCSSELGIALGLASVPGGCVVEHQAAAGHHGAAGGVFPGAGVFCYGQGGMGI